MPDADLWATVNLGMQNCRLSCTLTSLQVYRQKVKHLLYEHQNHIAKLKADAEVALKQQQDSFARQASRMVKGLKNWEYRRAWDEHSGGLS